MGDYERGIKKAVKALILWSFSLAWSMELRCPRHGSYYHVPLDLAGWHLQTPYRAGIPMFLCTVWDGISIHFRRNYLSVGWNREGEMADAL